MLTDWICEFLPCARDAIIVPNVHKELWLKQVGGSFDSSVEESDTNNVQAVVVFSKRYMTARP